MIVKSKLIRQNYAVDKTLINLIKIRYILCVHGLEIPLRCAPGLHFSPTLRVCVSPEIAQCDDGYFFECPEEDEPGVIVFIPDVEDCNAYFLCWQGN